MTQSRHPDLPVAASHLSDSESDYIRSAALLFEQMAVEVAPLAALNVTLARSVGAVRWGVEALAAIVQFIPIASDKACLEELKQLAKERIAGLADLLSDIMHEAESHMPELPANYRFNGGGGR
jgi:hypothetical protein